MSRRSKKSVEAQGDPNAPFSALAAQLKAMCCEMRSAEQMTELDFLHSLIVGRLRERFTSAEDAETINNFETALNADMDGSAERADATAKIVMMLINRIPGAAEKAGQLEEEMKAKMKRFSDEKLAPETFERRLVLRQVFYYMAAEAVYDTRSGGREAVQRVATLNPQQIQVQPLEELNREQVEAASSEDIGATPSAADQPSGEIAADNAQPEGGSGETETAPVGAEEPSGVADQQQSSAPAAEGGGEAANDGADMQKPAQGQERAESPLEYPPKTVAMAYQFGPVTRAMQNEIDYSAVDVPKDDGVEDISDATDAQFLNEINLALNLPPPDYRNPLIAPIDIAADDQSRTVAQVKSKFLSPSMRM